MMGKLLNSHIGSQILTEIYGQVELIMQILWGIFLCTCLYSFWNISPKHVFDPGIFLFLVMATMFFDRTWNNRTIWKVDTLLTWLKDDCNQVLFKSVQQFQRKKKIKKIVNNKSYKKILNSKGNVQKTRVQWKTPDDNRHQVSLR